VDGQDGVEGVVGVEEQGLELGLVEAPAELGDRLGQILLDGLALPAQLEEDVDVLPFALEPFEGLQVAVQALLLLLEGLVFLRVLPGFGLAQLVLDGRGLGSLAVDVKENLGCPRT
jgi:hypothetical protein